MAHLFLHSGQTMESFLGSNRGWNGLWEKGNFPCLRITHHEAATVGAHSDEGEARKGAGEAGAEAACTREKMLCKYIRIAAN